VLRAAWAGLRARRGRTALGAAGIVAAAIVVGTATTVAYGLTTGFDRAAREAGLPDVIARFDPEPRGTLDDRVEALPNLRARSYRFEATRVDLRASGRSTPQGVVHVVLDGGPSGYAVVGGRDLSPRPSEVVIERGLAREWGLEPGDPLVVGELGTLRVAGVAVAPDNVAFPLSSTARVYVGEQEIRQRYTGAVIDPNVALLWLNDPDRADITLAQARATSFGIGHLAFITRAGVEILLDQAAGIVIALLAAFSLVALVAAGTMLAAGAHADVQRRLAGIGVQRALGFTPTRIAGTQAVEAALVALPAGAVGLTAGALAVSGPAAGLLAALNEQPPGAALLPVLAACLAGIVTVVVVAATWPAWRAATRPPAAILRGGDLARRRRPTRAASAPTGGLGSAASLFALGGRFALAARGRWLAAVATIAVCAGVVTLMLGLASLLERLRDDPGTVGKRYQLITRLPAERLDEVRAIPGVEAAAERWSVEAADSFRLGEPLRLTAYRGDHTRFEAPPLAEGRRIASAGEAEVGVGLADALGLRPGSILAAQLPGGGEARFRVSGVVRALEHDGRIAYVRPDRLLAAEPDLRPSLAIRLEGDADRAEVTAALSDLGAPPQRVGGATTRDGRFLGVLAAVLRGVGLAVGLVCLYALVQALAITARERRGAVALLRAVGGDAPTVALVLAGAAVAVALPAALAGVALERLVFGPLVTSLAAGFAALPLSPTAGQIALVLGGMAALAALATALVARRAMREPVVAGLREE
jgi:ABC-type antimicrobial peptide transport system permease subunit